VSSSFKFEGDGRTPSNGNQELRCSKECSSSSWYTNLLWGHRHIV